MDIKKKKALGQNFLRRPETAARIIEIADINSNDNVIEIGPGAGIMTQYINKQKPQKLVLLELDSRLSVELSEKFTDATVINTDAARVSYEDICTRHFGNKDFIVLGNLPYNASTAILEQICGSGIKPRKMVFMFQKEVAQRIKATKGDGHYGRLSLLASEFYEIKQIMHLSPGAFSPPPKVDSSVLMFTLRNTPLIELKDRELYNDILISSFSGKRKMIRNNLKNYIPKQLCNDVLSKCGILSEQRADEIGIEQYAALANLLYKIRKDNTRAT